jgi:transcriptional regulator with XRE-family HTH domain
MIVTGKSPIPPYPPEHVAFGSRLRNARLAIPMSLRKFAASIEQSPTAVSQVEQGDLAMEETVSAMLLALRIKPSEYLEARFGKINSKKGD